MVTITKKHLHKLFIFTLFATSSLFSIGPAYIKDTYLPVADKVRYLSPIHGAMWWEGGVIRKYYEFGPKEEKDKHDKDWLPKADGSVRLVYALFNLLQGSFGISTNESYPATHLSAKTIAKIVAALEKSQGKISATEIENLILRDEDFQRSLKITKKNYAELYKKYKPILGGIEIKMGELYKEYVDKLQEKDKDKKTKLSKEQIEKLEKENPDLQKKYNENTKALEDQRKNINKELGKQDVAFLFDPIILETEDSIEQKYVKMLSLKHLELRKYQDVLSSFKVSEEILNIEKSKNDIVSKMFVIEKQVKQQQRKQTEEEKKTLQELKNKKLELESKLKILDPRNQIKQTIKELKIEISKLPNEFKTEVAQYEKLEKSGTLQQFKETGGEPGKRRIFELSQAIVDSYNDISNLYPPYCTYYILTAFMYRKAQSKQEFLDYFDILNKELGEIFRPQISRNDWLNSKFDESEMPTIKTNLEQWTKNPEMPILTDKMYEDAIYGQIIERFYKSNFPKAAGYATVTFGPKSFPDCAETTLRNLCNIILYDKKSGIFDLAQYKTIDPNSPFFKFYKKNRSATELEKHAVYQEWTEAIENQPWITYLQMVDSNNLVTRVPDYKKGFVVIPDDLPKEQLEELIKLNFIPIDGKTNKGFEVAPSVRNVIILLNHFFGLSLFTDLKQDFFKSDFNEIYLPQLTNKIDKLSYPTYYEKTIDNDDFSAEKHIILKFTGFLVIVIKGHAELTIDYELQNIVNLEQIIINQLTGDFDFVKNHLTMNLLSIYQLSTDQFNELSSQSKKVEEKIGKKSHVFSFIFFTDLFENNARVNILSKYLIPNMLSHDEILSRACTLTVFPMLKKLMEQPDLTYFNQVIDGIPSLVESIGNFVVAYTEQIYSSDLARSLNLLAKLVERKYEPSYQIATHVTEQTVKSDNVDIKTLGLGVFKKLVELNYEKAFEKAANAAENAINSTENRIQKVGLELFDKLFEKNYKNAFERATNAAEKAINSTDLLVQKAGIDLFDKLFEKGYKQAFEIATNAAKNALNSTEDQIQQAGLDLFDKLFEKGYEQAFEGATNAAKNTINSTNVAVQHAGLELFGKLVEKNYQKAFEGATNAAKNAIHSSDWWVQAAALNLFDKLLGKNYQNAFEIATNAAKNALNSTKDLIQAAVLKLFGKLVEKNYENAFETATNAAENAINSSSEYVQRAGFELFGKLFEKNYKNAFEKATNAAENAINSTKWQIQKVGLELFDKLFEKNYKNAFERATNAAEKAINSTKWQIQKAGFELFGKLVEKNYENVFETVANAAEEAINSPAEYKQQVGIELFGKLVEKNYKNVFETATDTAENALNSSSKHVKLAGIGLFGKLVERNYENAFETATDTAEKYINSIWVELQKAGFDLFGKLVEKNYKNAFEKAANAAEKAINNTKGQIHQEVLQLFGKLVEKNYKNAFKTATNAAKKAINSIWVELQKAGLELFGKLVEKNYKNAFESASNAAEKAINSEDPDIIKLGEELKNKLIKQKELQEKIK